MVDQLSARDRDLIRLGWEARAAWNEMYEARFDGGQRRPDADPRGPDRFDEIRADIAEGHACAAAHAAFTAFPELRQPPQVNICGAPAPPDPDEQQPPEDEADGRGDPDPDDDRADGVSAVS